MHYLTKPTNIFRNKIEIEEHAGRTYGLDVRKAINELESKVRGFINPEDLPVVQELSLMHI